MHWHFYRVRLFLWILLGLCALHDGGHPAFADDWPRWRGSQGNGHADSGAKIPSTFPETAQYVWRMKIGDGLASPVIFNRHVVYLDHQEGKETVHALDAATGNMLWSQTLDNTFKDSQYAPGPRCTPMIDEDRVYAQSCRGELKCLHLKNGSPIWSVNYTRDFNSIFIGEKGSAPGASRHGYNGMAIIDGPNLIALAGGTNGASIVCLDKKTGKIMWTGLSDTPGYAPPFIATLAGKRQILAYMADGIVGADILNGKELWRTPIKTAFSRHVTTPIAFRDLVIVSSHQAGTFATQITNNNGTIAAKIAWQNKPTAMNFSSPVLVGDFLYGLGPAKNLMCVDAATGDIRWSHEGLITTSADKAHSSFLVLKDRILTLTDSGLIVLFKAAPTKYEELGQLQICGANWCNPAYADGTLYVRDARELLAVKLTP